MNNLYNINSRHDLKLNEERYTISQWPQIRDHLDTLLLNMIAPPNLVEDCFYNHRHTIIDTIPYMRLAKPLPKPFSLRVEKEVWVVQLNIAFAGYSSKFYNDMMAHLSNGLKDLYEKLNQLS